MKKRIPWTEEDHNILSNCLNQGMTVEQINRDFLPNRSVDAIRTKMSRKNWKSPSKKWLLPFSIIMIPLAFIAGFIQADGSFSSSGGVDIGIARKDRHILEWACDQLQMPHSKITDIEKKSDSKSDKTYEASRLYLPKALGELFVQHFKLSPQKSKGQVVFPSFLNELCLKAYLLGIWFGNGCQSKSRGRSRVDFVSSYGFLKELLNDFFLKKKMKTQIY